jgi:hypothetical protein
MRWPRPAARIMAALMVRGKPVLGSGEDASTDYRRAEKKPPQAVAFAPGRRPRVAFYWRLIVKAPAAQLAEKAYCRLAAPTMPCWPPSACDSELLPLVQDPAAIPVTQ